MSRKYTIYAIDFDGTLCESIYPGIGAPNLSLIEHLKKRRKHGNKIILWTCRANERLQEAVEWCKQYGLEFDAVNENLPEMVEYWGNESRKVFADVYIDDKAVNKPKYRVPYKTAKINVTISEQERKRMSREILFRAKGQTSDKWYDGLLTRLDKDVCHIKDIRHNEWICDSETVCQYTGLTDKNGRKIFEGDIVSAWSEGSHAIGRVKQRIDGLWLLYPAWQNKIMWGLCPNDKGETTVEVIGNIFDNPNLLKE